MDAVVWGRDALDLADLVDLAKDLAFEQWTVDIKDKFLASLTLLVR